MCLQFIIGCLSLMFCHVPDTDWLIGVCMVAQNVQGIRKLELQLLQGKKGRRLGWGSKFTKGKTENSEEFLRLQESGTHRQGD